MSAQEKVMGLPELLTMILYHLDQRTSLTSAQRVCKEWHYLIKSTPSIQQALFLQPLPALLSKTTPVRNPLMAEIFPQWFQDFKVTEVFDDDDPGWTGYETEGVMTCKEFSELPIAKREHREALLRPGASWRRMLVQQPPLYTLGALKRRTTLGCTAAVRMWKFDQGLRLGAIYDVFFQAEYHTGMHMHWDGKIPLEEDYLAELGRKIPDPHHVREDNWGNEDEEPGHSEADLRGKRIYRPIRKALDLAVSYTLYTGYIGNHLTNWQALKKKYSYSVAARMRLTRWTIIGGKIKRRRHWSKYSNDSDDEFDHRKKRKTVAKEDR
ncbi:hypothetical protein PT974_01986 [Cladobotryum mycophilum]|uniref:F-box domain-containing protein n=1 Tax=Cladobotryum mycophilum TaxID=491253 RepID=A0ABR0SWZ0_9HYPO